MAKTKITIFISSRITDTIQYKGGIATLRDIRKDLKEQLEGLNVFGTPLFEVFTNETEPASSADIDSWDTCMKEIRAADIVVCIYDGHAGWSENPGEIGICHAELKTALDSESKKVRLIITEMAEDRSDDVQKYKNRLFRTYIDNMNIFRSSAKNGEEVIQKSLEAVTDAIIRLVYEGRQNPNKSAFFLGDSLNWSRLSYTRRKKAIETSIVQSLVMHGATGSDKNRLTITTDKITKDTGAGPVHTICFKCQGIPDSLSISEAKDLVGQPFLGDHLDCEYLNDQDAIGPVHLIGCHKSITEGQARKILGHPDATIVKAPFGIYLADNVQMIQMIFLQDCRNETETINCLQRFLAWLSASGEREFLFDRAVKRKTIIQAIHDVQEK
jgi:hypothetical protein